MSSRRCNVLTRKEIVLQWYRLSMSLLLRSEDQEFVVVLEAATRRLMKTTRHTAFLAKA
jgi:hypothetical protein